MQKRDYVLWAVVASIFVSLSLSIISPDVNETTTASITTIAAGVVILIFKQYFFGNEIPYSKKEEHTKDICEIYKLLTRVRFVKDRCDTLSWNDFQKSPTGYKHYLKFPTKYRPLESQSMEKVLKGLQVEQIQDDQLKHHHTAYLHYDRALEHLKKHGKYKPIYKHWENVKNLLDELNGKTSIEERLEDVIKEKMHHYFPALQSSTSETKFSDHYDTCNIIQFMMKYFKYQDNFSKTAANDLVCKESDGVKFICSKWDSKHRYITVKSDSDIDFETYKKLVKEMQNDDSLKDFYNKYKDEYDNITKELTDFKTELKNLITDLITGNLIGGKCGIGF